MQKIARYFFAKLHKNAISYIFFTFLKLIYFTHILLLKVKNPFLFTFLLRMSENFRTFAGKMFAKALTNAKNNTTIWKHNSLGLLSTKSWLRNFCPTGITSNLCSILFIPSRIKTGSRRPRISTIVKGIGFRRLTRSRSLPSSIVTPDGRIAARCVRNLSNSFL